MITEQQVVMTSVLVVLVGLVAFTIGLWTGHGREREYVDQLEKELDGLMALGPQEIAHEPWPVHVDQALAVAAERTGFRWHVLSECRDGDACPLHGRNEVPAVLAPTAVIPPDQDLSVTAWTKAMAADMDRFIAGLIGKADEQLREITR